MMADAPRRLDHLRRSAVYAGLFALAGVAALCVAAAYLLVSDVTDAGFVKMLIGVSIIAFGAVILSVYLFLRCMNDVMLKVESSVFRIYDAIRDIQSLQATGLRHLETAAENSQLSDTVRALMHRDRERTALRLAINEEIVRGDVEAAYALVELLESRHGYRNEAARLRREVDLSLERHRSLKVHEAVERVRQMIDQQQWDPARREMDRLLQEQPSHSEVRELPRLFQVRRTEHKRRLLKEWDESVQRNDVDRGIAVLRELDQYLTKNEAAALEESARGIFRTKLHNLGLAFSFAVTEHNWREALDVGKQIVEEFPNSRMAQEVRERLHILEKRAEEPPAADAVPAEFAVGATQA